jgi:hypothetical protein
LVLALTIAVPCVAGTVVAIDEAHGNYHTAAGRYAPLADLLRTDGCEVRGFDEPITAESLAGIDVLVIANALAPENRERWSLPTPSAFAAAEIAALDAWVAGGGGLLLIADHMPFPGAVADLAASFGVTMENGFVFDTGAGSGAAGVLVFSQDDGSLVEHPVTQGDADGVPYVVTFTGQGFRVDAGVEARPLLVLPAGSVLLLPETAWEFDEGTPRRDAAGLLQGAALSVGDGRVAVFGEAAMFTSQPGGPGEPPMGFDHPDAPWNRRFARNVVRWLAGDLPAD